MPNRNRTIQKPTLAVTACGGCSRLWCLTTRHMHRSQHRRNWSSELWGESYKSCLLDNVCDMILSSKVYPAFFDRSERALNTHARSDELLHERNMTLYQLCQSGNILSPRLLPIPFGLSVPRLSCSLASPLLNPIRIHFTICSHVSLAAKAAHPSGCAAFASSLLTNRESYGIL